MDAHRIGVAARMDSVNDVAELDGRWVRLGELTITDSDGALPWTRWVVLCRITERCSLRNFNEIRAPTEAQTFLCSEETLGLRLVPPGDASQR